MKRYMLAAVLIVILPSAARAQRTGPVEWFPGGTYDPSIPVPRDFLGYEIGDDYTYHHQMKAYMEGEAYYGHIGETKAVGVKLRFLETLREKSRDPKIREESRKRMRSWDQSKFL